MDFFPVPGFSQSSLKGSTLIVPSVSLANLPQLAVDLIISSLGLERVGWVGDGSTTVPFVGAGDKGEVVTGGLECASAKAELMAVYGSTGGAVYVMQQRSPTIKTEKDAHVALLHSFITANHFSLVLVLTSLDAANQDDAQLQTPLQRILPPSSSSSSHPAISRLNNLAPLQLHLTEPLSPRPLNGIAGGAGGIYPPFLPGGGLARRLLVALKDSDVPHAGISAWCVEGDNREDARAMAAAVLHVVGTAKDVELREPKSWKSLFGNTEGWSGGLGSNAEIYG